MGNVAELDTTRLVIAAIIGLALLLVLIIKFKVHAMLSILIGAIAIGLIAGMPFEEIVTAVDDGIGNTLKGIALLVGLGSMFGAILEASGGAQTLAVTMVKKFGDEKAAWALGITGLVISIPVFSDAGLIILIPLAFSLAKEQRNLPCLCDPAFSRTCRRTRIYSADTWPGISCHNVKCGTWMGYFSRCMLWIFCNDRCRSGLGSYLRKEILCSGSGSDRKPGRY